ncbi:MAG: sigma-E processing peptidase SpoIIGA [Clostridia bacterium]|nr:sigma-E processing peptidase SpoIIGA [Clostridia bacterium]
MKTLYVDVYFLINFTVDALAIYFASSLSRVTTTVVRLLLASLVGALYAVAGILLIDSQFLMYPLSLVFFVLTIWIASGRVSVYRRVKFGVAFLLFEIVIGGLVYYGYCLLDRYLNLGEEGTLGAENRNLLILSLIVLTSIGVLKLVMTIFRNCASERSVRLRILYKGMNCEFDALVDSGNLARDPFDKTPVMLINSALAKRIFGIDSAALEAPESASIYLKPRIRVIPLNIGGVNSIVYGFKPDEAVVLRGRRAEKISLIIATNKRVENYGGYSALIPLTAMEGVG